MSEEDLISLLTLLMIAFGLFTAIALVVFNMKAAYGRYHKETSLWQWSINANLAWFVQDLPALLMGLYYTVAQWSSAEGLPLVNASVLTLYTFHYSYRTFIHSLGIRGGKPTPLHIALNGIVYVAWEAYIVCAYHAKYAYYHSDHVTSTASLT
ncbi:steroid-5-alpha-reductase 1-like protein, partial [Aphelenchoides avenae]